MNREIVERINLIKKGEIKQGYKKTNAGIIPNDWENTLLGKKIRIFRGASPRPKGDPKYYGGNIPRLMIEDVTRDGKYTYPCIDSLTEEGALKSRLMPKGSIVLSCSGTKVGIPGILGVDACIHDGFFGFDELDELDEEFLYYFFGLLNIKLQSSATKGGVFNNLTTDIMKQLPVAIPNIHEQKKIALILSNCDKSIGLKEKLLEEKQKHKKGLMERILTGKVRFREFKEQWKNIKLGKVMKERKEIGYNELELLAITSANGVVRRNELDIKDTSSEDKSKYKRILPGDIGYNTMRMWQGVSGLSKFEGIVSPAYTVLKPTDEVDSEFMAYLFKLPKIINLFHRYSQGLVSDTLNLKYENFKGIKIYIPQTIDEQKKIASILRTCDNEIILLVKEIDELRQQKKGLMKLLLTGIVRVKCD